MSDEPIQNFILIRGLTRESAHWGDFVPQLKTAFPNANLIHVDLPGAGSYFRDRSPNTVKDIQEKVREQALEQRGSLASAKLVGVSLGGMIAWEWMLNYPDEIESAVLINTSLGGLSPFYQRLNWRCYRQLLTAAFNRQIGIREPKLLELLSNRKDNFEQTASEWIRIQQARPVSGRNAFRQLYAAATYRPTDKKPEPPVLLLNSLGDQLVSPSCSEAIAQKWRLELLTHPWGGHDLTLDDPGWVVTKIHDWLRKSGQG